MYIRDFAIGDEPDLYAVFHSAIHEVACADYTQEQVNAWAPQDLDPERWAERMRSISPFVAEIDNKIVGYADVQPSGYIDHFFVSGSAGRRGVGGALMQRIHETAKALGTGELTAHVSRTAQPFFEKFGFRVVEQRDLEIQGVVLRSALMSKRIEALPSQPTATDSERAGDNR